MDKQYWITPPEIYKKLDSEFHFNFDPCPYPLPENFNGVDMSWGESNWVNPPFRKSDGMYGAGPTAFIRKAISEQKLGKTSVVILNTMSFINMLIEAGAEFRSMGRVRWLDARSGEPWKTPSNTTLFILRGLPDWKEYICNVCGTHYVNSTANYCSHCGTKRNDNEK